MKGKHDKDVAELEGTEILRLISSKTGEEHPILGNSVTSMCHHRDSEATAAANRQSPANKSSRRGRTASARRRSTLKALLPKKNIVTPDQYDWANRLIPSFQLGIHVALTKISDKKLRDLLFHDFFFIEVMRFDPSVLELVGKGIESFTLKVYAPMAFAHFRKLFSVRDDLMRRSLCDATLTMVVNAGASGSIFYVSPDREFVLKTVTKKEAKFLQELLPEYYMNIHQNPSTFLPRFYGLFVVKRYTYVMRLVIMNNIIRPGLVERKFDLKGSRYHRFYRADGSNDGNVGTQIPTLKDLDFIQVFPNGLMLTPDVHEIVFKTLERDVLVLQSFDIMDYSLLLAIRQDTTLDPVASATGLSRRAERASRAVSVEDSYCEIHKRDHCQVPSCSIRRFTLKLAEIILPCGGIPAATEHGEPLVLYMGIIDILQDYNIKKIMEHFYKTICVRSDDGEISVQPPGYYAARFRNFVTHSVFRQVPATFPLSLTPTQPECESSKLDRSSPSTTAAQLPAVAEAGATYGEMVTSLFSAGPERVESVPASPPPAPQHAASLPPVTSGRGEATSSATSAAKSKPAPTPLTEAQARLFTGVIDEKRLRLPAVVSTMGKVPSETC